MPDEIWADMQRLARQIEKARRRGWHQAAPRLAEELSCQADNCHYRLLELLATLRERTNSPAIPTQTEICQEIPGIPMSRRNGFSNQEAQAEASAAPLGRASWSGFLRLSLVVVPVKAYPAVSTTETISFHQLHAHCGQRITYQKVCPVHGKVESEAIVRGYQYAPDQYVVVETSELDNLRPAKDQGLVLEQCIDAGQIESALFSGRSLYLVPEGLPAQRPYLHLDLA